MTLQVNQVIREIAERGAFWRNQDDILEVLRIRAREVGSHFEYFHLPTLQEAVNSLSPAYTQNGLGGMRFEHISKDADTKRFSLQTHGLFRVATSNLDEVRQSGKVQDVQERLWGFTRNQQWLEVLVTEVPYFYGDFGFGCNIAAVSFKEVTLKEISRWQPFDIVKVWEAFTELTQAWYEKAKERQDRALKIHVNNQMEDAILHYNWTLYKNR
jgi:hypothetical protein